jgi:hypothetical protein
MSFGSFLQEKRIRAGSSFARKSTSVSQSSARPVVGLGKKRFARSSLGARATVMGAVLAAVGGPGGSFRQGTQVSQAPPLRLVPPARKAPAAQRTGAGAEHRSGLDAGLARRPKQRFARKSVSRANRQLQQTEQGAPRTTGQVSAERARGVPRRARRSGRLDVAQTREESRPLRKRSAAAMEGRAAQRGVRAKRTQVGPSFAVAPAAPAPPVNRPPPPDRYMAALVSAEAKAADVAGQAAEAALKLPTRSRKGHVGRRERGETWAEQSARALLERLPEVARERLRADADLPEGDREGSALAALLGRAGTDGMKLHRATKKLAYVEAFARSIGVPVWPVRAGRAALMIRSIHQRATTDSTGSRGGATVADAARDDLWTLAECGCPIEMDDPAVEAAAPRQKAGGGRVTVAGTAPLKVLFHLAELATAEKPSIRRFMARSLLITYLNGARVADAMSLRIWLDEVDPDGVIRGEAIWKGGSRIQLYAPARFAGRRFEWLREHVADCARHARGHIFPDWSGPWGARSNLAKAQALLATVADETDIRKVIDDLLGVAPLALSHGEIAALGLRGHTVHFTMADMSRFIGRFPTVPFTLPERVARGFDLMDRRALGHWLRDPWAETESGERAPGAARTAAAQVRGQSQESYTRDAGRTGERQEQLDVRERLDEFIALAVAHDGRPWAQWPEGRRDFAILRPGASVA